MYSHRSQDLINPIATRARLGGLTVVLALSAIAVVGCTSSRDGSAAKSGTSTTAAAQSPDGSSHASAGATAPSSTTDRSAAATQVCRVISLNLDVLTKAATSPDDPSLDQGIAQLRQLHDAAPTEIKGDIQVIADFDQKVLDAVRSGGSPDDIQETPELTAALSHEAQWVATHCPR